MRPPYLVSDRERLHNNSDRDVAVVFPEQDNVGMRWLGPGTSMEWRKEKRVSPDMVHITGILQYPLLDAEIWFGSNSLTDFPVAQYGFGRELEERTRTSYAMACRLGRELDR